MNAEPILPSVPQPKTNKLALSSLILGILGLIFCVVGGVFAIPGLICGIIGMKRVKNSGGAEKGHGLAVAGTVLSAVGLVVFPVFALLAAIAVPNFVKARDVAQRNGCVANLRTLDGAKATWALENRKMEGETPTDADLFGAAKYVAAKPACPKGGIYTLNPVGAKPTCSVPGHSF
jgi:competence protein ComGC